MSNDASSICLAICTCNRPDLLAKLIADLKNADLSTLSAIAIVDNHRSGNGLEIVHSQIGSDLAGIPVHAFLEENPGIAHARNRAIDEARKLECDAIVFIDDDEQPSHNWLNELAATKQQTSALVVSGPVIPVFETPPTSWDIYSNFYDQKQPCAPNGPPVNSTANVLIALSALSPLGDTPFDPDFGLSGGSDQVLFTKLHRANVPMAWAQRAVVFETVPTNRKTQAWVKQRAFRNGNINMRCELLFCTSGRLKLVTRSLIRAIASMICGGLLAAINLITGSGSRAGLIMMNKALGRLSALFGSVYHEYAERHQR